MASARISAADEVGSWLAVYGEKPSLFVLLIIVRRLCDAEDPAAAAEAAGVSGPWLREQGELAARMSLRGGRGPSGVALTELRSLRLLLAGLGVPCDGWEISDAGIADSLLRYAQGLCESAVRLMSPYPAWEVLQMAADGRLASLDAVAPGARDVVTGYAARYVLESITDAHGLGAIVLGQLREMRPALDQAVLSGFQQAGIPVDEEGLRHAETVCEVRHLWAIWRDGEADGDVLAFACAQLLAERTVRADEIGASEDGVWAAARSWVAGQVAKIEAGDHEAGRSLSTFASWSRLGYAPFGVSAGQVASWEEARAGDCWARARSGDGPAAFDVIVHCEEPGNSYEGTTGLPRSQARAELQAVMNAYAAGLRRQVESAAARKWARPPFLELRSFASRVRVANDVAVARGGRPLADTPWEQSPADWRRFYSRYVGGRSRAD